MATNFELAKVGKVCGASPNKNSPTGPTEHMGIVEICPHLFMAGTPSPWLTLLLVV